MGERVVDVIVIGAGAVGENVADRAVQGGLSVLLVEAELVGGECSFWACMPSKALLRAGAVRRAAAAVSGSGVSGAGLDADAILARRDEVIHGGDDSGQVRWVASAGIDLLRGHARLVGERQVRVESADGTVTDVRATHAVAVCTGSVPRLPDIPGLAEAQPWSSRDATRVAEVPSRVAVLGGGVVGCELATALHDLGAQVTIIARGALLSGQEPFAGEAVSAALTERGVDVRLGAQVARVTSEGATHVVHLGDGATLEVDRILVATGREPRTSDLGVDAVGLRPGEALDVDDSMLVRGTDWLYAVGDVTGRAPLTHQGKYQARAAGDAIAARAAGAALDDAPWGRHVASADARAVPQVTFTDPEVASVGLTADAARDAGLRVRVVDYDLSWLAGATVTADDYRGQGRAVVDEDRGVLVGVTLVGAGVGELLHAATVAIVGEVPLHRLWHAVPSYPTLSEVWLRWLEALGRDTADSR